MSQREATHSSGKRIGFNIDSDFQEKVFFVCFFCFHPTDQGRLYILLPLDEFMVTSVLPAKQKKSHKRNKRRKRERYSPRGCPAMILAFSPATAALAFLSFKYCTKA